MQVAGRTVASTDELIAAHGAKLYGAFDSVLALRSAGVPRKKSIQRRSFSPADYVSVRGGRSGLLGGIDSVQGSGISPSLRRKISGSRALHSLRSTGNYHVGRGVWPCDSLTRYRIAGFNFLRPS